jgi:ribose/xylose/arabinose/galactoside ABC-type transport system permease subunit
VFVLWVPETWLTWLTHRSVLNQNAILVVVAIGLLVPLAAGVFDLSIAATISALGAVTVSWGLVEPGGRCRWRSPLALDRRAWWSAPSTASSS